jgi:Flp pilus assembly protein TadB
MLAAVLALKGGQTILLIIAAPMPLCAYFLIGWYPKRRAESERIRGLGEVSQLINYMTMAMKTTPNMERAAQFAAENLDGSLGRRLRRLLWEVGLRVHNSVDEAMTKFANYWGRWREDFRRSIYLIRSSMLERFEGLRVEVLDKALDVCLQGTREQMERFAASLHLPTLVIYSIGVLLPLVLVAVLPVLATVGVSVSVWQISAIYCVILPLTVWMLSRRVLAKRPAAFPPPRVPNDAAARQTMLIAAVLGSIVASPAIACALGKNISQDLAALSALWGAGVSITFYLHRTTTKAYKLRQKILQIEHEFCDSLFQLGNRISEGRPAEDAFMRVAETMRGSGVSEVFERASANIMLGNLGLRSALFDERSGALKNVHSQTVRSAMKMLVDVIQRSTRAAGEAILRTASHLKELKRVEADVRKSLGEVVSSMRSVALFFAPLIASVTSRMQGVLAGKSAEVSFLGGTPVSPSIFLLVLGIYTVLLTIILISYATEIEVGDDGLAKRAALAQSLPVALVVFTIGAVVGGRMMAAIVG